MVKLTLAQLADSFGFFVDPTTDFNPGRILPHRSAPVIKMSPTSGPSIVMMNFSLIPSWSKERRPKFATHNARFDTLDSKASWRKPFLSNHCVVPISTFIEPIYSGDLAGNMVAFEPVSTDITLFAAGIFDTWQNSDTDQVIESFAIITDRPSPFVDKIGHDRQPLFISEQHLDEWLAQGELPPAKLKDLLQKLRQDPALKVSVDRPLKAGWQKRVKQT